MIELTLRHIDDTPHSTLSELLYDHHHLGYVIEDGHRDLKVPGSTRIPAGRYQIIPRKEGGFYQRYTRRWPKQWFVPWLIKVPNFTWILIHIGNFINDTRGCLLICTDYARERGSGNYYGLKSTEAYLRLYEFLADAFQRNEEVFITITRSKKLPPIEPPAPDPVEEAPPEPAAEPLVVVQSEPIPSKPLSPWRRLWNIFLNIFSWKQ